VADFRGWPGPWPRRPGPSRREPCLGTARYGRPRAGAGRPVLDGRADVYAPGPGAGRGGQPARGAVRPPTPTIGNPHGPPPPSARRARRARTRCSRYWSAPARRTRLTGSTAAALAPGPRRGAFPSCPPANPLPPGRAVPHRGDGTRRASPTELPGRPHPLRRRSRPPRGGPPPGSGRGGRAGGRSVSRPDPTVSGVGGRLPGGVGRGRGRRRGGRPVPGVASAVGTRARFGPGRVARRRSRFPPGRWVAGRSRTARGGAPAGRRRTADDGSAPPPLGPVGPWPCSSCWPALGAGGVGALARGPGPGRPTHPVPHLKR